MMLHRRKKKKKEDIGTLHQWGYVADHHRINRIPFHFGVRFYHCHQQSWIFAICTPINSHIYHFHHLHILWMELL